MEILHIFCLTNKEHECIEPKDLTKESLGYSVVNKGDMKESTLYQCFYLRTKEDILKAATTRLSQSQLKKLITNINNLLHKPLYIEERKAPLAPSRAIRPIDRCHSDADERTTKVVPHHKYSRIQPWEDFLVEPATRLSQFELRKLIMNINTLLNEPFYIEDRSSSLPPSHPICQLNRCYKKDQP